jgi:RND family efflux transporter MFP subunit
LVKAPSEGQLALADIYEGSYVTAGQELFSVVNLDDLVFKAQIDEADISHVKAGMPATISLDSYPNKTYDGAVSQIDSKITTLSDGGSIVICDVSFNNKDFMPILGLNGSTDIEFEKTQNLVAVPIDSVFEELNKSYTFKVLDGQVFKQEVTTGVEGDEYLEITSGVSAGDQVITGVADLKLKNGQRVQIQ